MKGAEAMRKRIRAFLVSGIIGLISGGVLVGLHVGPKIIPITLFSIGGAFIAIYFAARGGPIIRDEMVKRIDALSAYYSWIASFYCLVVLSIIQYFYPSLLNGWLLWIIMMFMSLSFMLIRSYLLRRGKTE